MPSSPTAITALITKIDAGSSTVNEDLMGWLVSLLLSGAECPGFWSGEIVPPGEHGAKQWMLVERFRDAACAEAWRRSEIRGQLLAKLASWPGGNELLIADDITKGEMSGSAATAIITEVRRGMEAAYWGWERKVQMAQASFPGYKGVYLQPPVPGRDRTWVTLLRFDSPYALESWIASEQRQNLLQEGKQFMIGTRLERLSSSFPGWFPKDAASGENAPRWKTQILVLLALYPIIALQCRYITPLVSGYNFAFGLALTTILSISLGTWVTLPVIIRVFDCWLFPKAPERMKINCTGAACAAVVFLIEVATFWNLMPANQH